MRRIVNSFFATLLWCAVHASAALIDFEGLGSLEPVTNQFAALTFSNTASLTAGISLNETDFPPKSGVNVASDDGGPITILFSTPVTSFSGFFTYVVPITLEAFDVADQSVDLTTSIFGANDGFTGQAGSSPSSTRVPFRNLIDYLERNHGIDEFLDSFPTVSREQVVATLEAAHEAVSLRAYSSR